MQVSIGRSFLAGEKQDKQNRGAQLDEDCVRSCLKNKTKPPTHKTKHVCLLFFYFVVLFLVYFVFSFSSGSCPASHEEQLEFVRTGLKNTLEKLRSTGHSIAGFNCAY